MLETTFLGHQGWRFATGEAAVLVDPLLVEPFGHGGAVGVVYPPRALNLPAMDPVDAVVLTHEHEDHFNIPSMNRISRDIPIFIPERSSSALGQILREMGFSVRTLAPGRTIEIADLQLTIFATDHVRHDEQDEWDTTPFLVFDRKDGGSFFSPVDVGMSASLEAQLLQRGIAPGLFAYANNTMNLSFQERPPRAPPSPIAIAARFIADHVRRPRPGLASLMCGGGFSFTGARAWMNHLFFPLDSGKLFDALTLLGVDEQFFVPAPGWQIVVDSKQIRRVSETAPFLTTTPKEKWPDRTYRPSMAPDDGVEPASGKDSLPAADLKRLEQRLEDFARFLYGRTLFRALYTLAPGPSETSKRARFAICAISGEASHVFEFQPTEGRFVLTAAPAPLSEYAVALECYASDLLAFLDGELAPSALMFGRLCRWRGSAENTTAAIDNTIWQYGHPLRRQAEHLAFYRALLAKEPKDPPHVRARKART